MKGPSSGVCKRGNMMFLPTCAAWCSELCTSRCLQPHLSKANDRKRNRSRRARSFTGEQQAYRPSRPMTRDRWSQAVAMKRRWCGEGRSQSFPFLVCFWESATGGSPGFQFQKFLSAAIDWSVFCWCCIYHCQRYVRLVVGIMKSNDERWWMSEEKFVHRREAMTAVGR